MYAVVCGSETQQERFDTDAPRIYLGPVRLHSFDPVVPFTKVEGTDCPRGTTVTVTITVDGRATVVSAAIDQYGDWSVDLPVPAGSAPMTVVAACGEVGYPALTVTTTATRPPATHPTTPVMPTGPVESIVTTPSSVPTAPPATARPGSAPFTG